MATAAPSFSTAEDRSWNEEIKATIKPDDSSAQTWSICILAPAVEMIRLAPPYATQLAASEAARTIFGFTVIEDEPGNLA